MDFIKKSVVAKTTKKLNHLCDNSEQTHRFRDPEIANTVVSANVSFLLPISREFL